MSDQESDQAQLVRALRILAADVPDPDDAVRSRPAASADAQAGRPHPGISNAIDDDEDGYVFPAPTRQLLARDDLSIESIPPDLLSTRGYRALQRVGIVRVGQLAELRVDRVLEIRNFGVTTLRALRHAIAAWDPAVPRGEARLISESESGDEGAEVPIPQGPLDEWLPQELRDQLKQIGQVLEHVSARDTRFGARRFQDLPMSTLLAIPVAASTSSSVANLVDSFAPGLALLADRVARPIPLIDELEEVLPGTERGAAICRSRWGWDGTGPKTLEETGKEFNLTRERIRQIEKKTRERRLRGVRAYLPTAEALISLLRDMGGAAYETDLATVALDRGLIRSALEVSALESLAELGFVSESDIKRFRGEAGDAVLSLGVEDTSELLRIGVRTRRILGRRGIAAIAEVMTDLETEHIPATEGEVRAFVERSKGVEYLGGQQFFWHPDDSDSAFVRRLEKPLVVLGPQKLHALGRALRRGSRSHTYGPVIPMPVLAEALARSPFFRKLDDDRWEWTGPNRPVPLGIAEAPLVELLNREGPTLSFPELRSRLIDIEGVTLSVTLSHSPLIERVSHGVYALTGAQLLPGDVEDARRRARTHAPAVQLVESGWEGGAVVIRWDVLDRRLWNGVLNVPTKTGLQGGWELRGSDESWTTTVEGGTLWGGIGIWISAQDVQYPARLILRFHPTDRHIDPELIAHGEIDRGKLRC